MKWEYFGTGLTFLGIGITMVLALPPPWWPTMPKRLVRAGLYAGLALIIFGCAFTMMGIWPEMLRPKLLPILAICTGLTILTAGIVALFEPTAVHVKKEEHLSKPAPENAKLTLYLQCIASALPSTVPSEGMVHVFSPMRQDRLRIVPMPRFGVPGEKWEWDGLSKDWLSTVLRCQLTTYGDAPVFDVQLPVNIALTGLERAPDGNGSGTTNDIEGFEDIIPIPKLDPGKDGFVFYVYHFGPKVATLTFVRPPTYTKSGDTQRSEAILKQDPGLTFGNHAIWPMSMGADQERGKSPAKSPPEPLPPTPSPQGKQGRWSRRRSRA
jgi:hypothetical protein